MPDATTQKQLENAHTNEFLKIDLNGLGIRDYSSDEVASFVKPREGFLAIAKGVVEVFPQYKNKLELSQVSTDSIRAKVERIEALTRTLAHAEKLTEMLGETRLAIIDDLAGVVYQIDRRARDIGRRDPEVAAAFDFIAAWLSLGKRQPQRQTPATAGRKADITGDTGIGNAGDE